MAHFGARDALKLAAFRLTTLRTCRSCGCTGHAACPSGCSWVLLDLPTPTGVCGECAEELGWDPLQLAYVGTEVLASAEARAILAGAER